MENQNNLNKDAIIGFFIIVGVVFLMLSGYN